MVEIPQKVSVYWDLISVPHIFQDTKYKFMVAVLVEYIKSLNQYQIPAQVGRTLYKGAFLPLAVFLLL